MGILQINSTPEGAEVFLNDTDANMVTPATLKTLKVGDTGKVTLKKAKFKDWTKTVSLPDANPMVLNPTLEVIPVGTIKVVTTPPGAKILLDGKDTGKVSPANLEDLPISQTYAIRLEMDKHRPVEDKVTVYSIEPMEFNKKLEEIFFAPIKVATIPPGARIFLDNNDTGQTTPATLPNLEVGKSYSIHLTEKGYKDVVHPVDLQDKQGVAFQERLVKVEEKTPEQLALEKQKQQEAEKQKQLELQKQQEAQQQAQQQTQPNKDKQAQLKAQQSAVLQKSTSIYMGLVEFLQEQNKARLARTRVLISAGDAFRKDELRRGREARVADLKRQVPVMERLLGRLENLDGAWAEKIG